MTAPDRTKDPMSHPNAARTPRHRLKVARLVVDQNWPISEIAARFQVSWPPVKSWVDRYLADESMEDRSSRPKHSPNKTPLLVAKRCISLRIRLREGPVQLGARLEIAPSTAHRILTAARLNRLTQLDRATGEPVRRYEHPHPGSLVHVDVKKLGNIPDGGGWRYVGRRQGDRNRSGTPDKSKNKWHNPKMGYAFVHTVIDDHSRVAFTEVPTTKRLSLPLASYVEPPPGSPNAASQSSECCQTTARPTAATCGEMHARHWRSDPSEHVRTGHRRMGKWNASTELWPKAGPMPAATNRKRNAVLRSRRGSTTTTNTDRTRPAATIHHSQD